MNQSCARKKFLCWGDVVGVHKNHPPCDCGLPSRYVWGEDEDLYRCAGGECEFKEEA